ncbi:uncharacterized protein LOC106881828 [Octopus bimaculoides]|uniref:uncharacterized protein LOC106881828 n=1 Tax=Octopus bimaculoides TaxID=37653 RepID=UPI00071C5B50|nr:uncharacterized protein LOC106881828 [Octopus bimaculoides]|eukprot:XP_014787829.1 PREDICTED: uncharacterized protein LOC106881828 [Octopus bimaculoides]
MEENSKEFEMSYFGRGYMQASVTILLPPSTGDSIISFAQLEASFEGNRVTTEKNYNIMLSNLLPLMSNEIRDLLTDPVRPGSYSSVKEEILNKTSSSKQKRFAKLFNNEQLDDAKPSQLLRRMRELLGSQLIEEPFLKVIFFNKLLNNMQTLLPTVKEQSSLKQLADLSDGILDISSSSENSRVSQIDRETVNALSSISSELKDINRDYEKQFKMLTDKIENLQFGRDSRSSPVRNSGSWRVRSKIR